MIDGKCCECGTEFDVAAQQVRYELPKSGCLHCPECGRINSEGSARYHYRMAHPTPTQLIEQIRALLDKLSALVGG